MTKKKTKPVAKKKLPDFQVKDEGTLVMLTAVSPKAKMWVAENVEVESYQQIGESVAVGHRYIQDIIEGILHDDMTVEAL